MAIGLVLGSGVAEMLHLGADGRHLAADREDVQSSVALAARLGDGDPVDSLEPVFDDLCATLTSPRIRHAVTALASALIRVPGGEMGADDVLRAIVLAMGETPAGENQPPIRGRFTVGRVGQRSACASRVNLRRPTQVSISGSE